MTAADFLSLICQDFLLNTDAMFNAASLVDETKVTNLAYYGKPTPAVVHVPRRQRVGMWKAALTRSFVNSTIVVVVWGQGERDFYLARRFLSLGVLNRIHVVNDYVAFEKLSLLDPFRVVFVDSTSAEDRTRKIRHGLQTILQADRSVFVMDGNTMVRQSFASDLEALSMYGHGHVVSMKTNPFDIVDSMSATVVPLFVSFKAKGTHSTNLPSSESHLNTLQFPPWLAFVDDVRERAFWPDKIRSRVRFLILRATNAVSKGYRADFWGFPLPDQHHGCLNHTVFASGPRRLTPNNVFFELQHMADFLRFSADNNTPCIVHPGYRLGLSSVLVPLDYLVNVPVLLKHYGLDKALLFARTTHMRDSTSIYFTKANHSRINHKRMRGHSSICSPFGLAAWHCLPHRMNTTLSRATAHLPRPFSCAVDFRSAPSRVAETAAAHKMEAFVNATRERLHSALQLAPDSPILVVGSWRVAAESLRNEDGAFYVPEYANAVQSRLARLQLGSRKRGTGLNTWFNILDALLCRGADARVYVSDWRV